MIVFARAALLEQSEKDGGISDNMLAFMIHVRNALPEDSFARDDMDSLIDSIELKNGRYYLPRKNSS